MIKKQGMEGKGMKTQEMKKQEMETQGQKKKGWEIMDEDDEETRDGGQGMKNQEMKKQEMKTQGKKKKGWEIMDEDDEETRDGGKGMKNQEMKKQEMKTQGKEKKDEKLWMKMMKNNVQRASEEVKSWMNIGETDAEEALMKTIILRMPCVSVCKQSEPVFLNVYGAQESIPRN